MQGIQIYFRLKGFKLNVYAPSRQIVKQKKTKPNFALDVDGFNLSL
jgi:hypothetical protein